MIPITAAKFGRGRVGSIVSVALMALVLVAATACSPSPGGKHTGTAKQASGKAKLLVWADAVRAKSIQDYEKSHPDVSITVNVMTNDATAYEEKLTLANKAGKGWPDLLAAPNYLASDLSGSKFGFTVDMSKALSKDVTSQFAQLAISQCTANGTLVCLPNEISPSLLFYNKKLMATWGYTVPTTWEEYEQLGLRVARDHPGYVVGTAGAASNDRSYLASSQCPFALPDGTDKIYSNLSDNNCTRMVNLMDSLVKAGSMSRSAQNDPAFLKQYGTTGKWLMMYGPAFWTRNIFKGQYKTPSGVLGAALPPRWSDQQQPTNGDNAGIGFFASRHSKYLKAAQDLAVWLSTGAAQTSASNVTTPAYKPALTTWATQVSSSGLLSAQSGTLPDLIEQAESEVWPDLGNLPIYNSIAYGKVIPIELAKGTTVSASLAKWQQLIDQEGKAAGYTVVHKK